MGIADDLMQGLGISDPVIRLGVTGLSRAGKTVFITSLVANLMDQGRMPQLGAEALTLLVPGLVLVLHDRDLGTAKVFNDLGSDLDVGQGLGIGGDLVPIDQQQRRKLNGAACLTGDAVKGHEVSNGNLLLAAACADNRVHHLGTHFSRQSDF